MKTEKVRGEITALARILTAPETTSASIQAHVVELLGDELPRVIIRAREVLTFARHVIDVGEIEMRLRANREMARRAEIGSHVAWSGTSAETAVGESVSVVMPGERWIDKATGVIHRFEGDLGDWRVADPRGLRAALASVTRPGGARYFTESDVDRAVPVAYKPDHRVLTEFAKIDPLVAEVIADFRAKERGPAHLREERP